MSQQENPEFHSNGQVKGCSACPLDNDDHITRGGRDTPCHKWWYRNGDTEDLICPTKETYEEACRMAEELS